MKDLLKETIAFKKSQTTNYLALFIFGLFASIMVLVSIKVFNSTSITDGDGQEWFSFLKDGFIIIGNLLTALVGYYFGYRAGDAALEKAGEIYSEAEQIQENIETLSPTIEEDMSGIHSINPSEIEEAG